MLLLDDDALVFVLSHLVEPLDLARSGMCCRQLHGLVSEIAHNRLTALKEKYAFDDLWHVDDLIPDYDGNSLLAPPETLRELRDTHAAKWRLPGPLERSLSYYPGTECLRPFKPWNAQSLQRRSSAIHRLPWQNGGAARQIGLQVGDASARIRNGELQYLCHHEYIDEPIFEPIFDRLAIWVHAPFPSTCSCCAHHSPQSLDAATFEAHCMTWHHREAMASARGHGRLDDRYADPRDHDPPLMWPGAKKWEEQCTTLEQYDRLRTYVQAVRDAIESKLDPMTWNEAERENMSELASHFRVHMQRDQTLENVMEIRGIRREAALELLEAHLPDCTPEACGRVTLRIALDDFEQEGINRIVRPVLIDGLESVEPAASSSSSVHFMCCLSGFFEGFHC